MSYRLSPHIAARFDDADRKGIWLSSQRDCPRSTLQRLVVAGVCVSPRTGCFALRERYEAMGPTERTRRTIKTLARKHPDWTFCSHSSVLLHGLQVSQELLYDVHVLVPGGCNVASKGVKRHREVLAEGDVRTVHGVRATALPRALMEALCDAPFRFGLAMAESALRWGRVSREELTS